jgi:hypothetical protein
VSLDSLHSSNELVPRVKYARAPRVHLLATIGPYTRSDKMNSPQTVTISVNSHAASHATKKLNIEVRASSLISTTTASYSPLTIRDGPLEYLYHCILEATIVIQSVSIYRQSPKIRVLGISRNTRRERHDCRNNNSSHILSCTGSSY